MDEFVGFSLILILMKCQDTQISIFRLEIDDNLEVLFTIFHS